MFQVGRVKNNFLKLYFGIFVSELGGFLTNTVILFHVNQATGGSKFHLGLALAAFVGPLAAGNLIGGAVGEAYDRRKVMVTCDLINLALVFLLLFFGNIYAILAVRAIIVFFAGVYNPSRLAIVQEIVEPGRLRLANALFTALYACLHLLAPTASAYAFKRFGGVIEVFAFNIFTYVLGTWLVYSIRYEGAPAETFRPVEFARGIREGFFYLYRRDDLRAMLRNFAIGGFCMGVFHPILLPFISEVFKGDESTYAKLMTAYGLGGVLGGFAANFIMKFLSKGRLLVVCVVFQAIALLLWTQVAIFALSFMILFFWGMGAMTIVATYINYVQVNVPKQYQARSFSIFDQSISLNVCTGAAVVSLVSDKLTGYELVTLTAGAAVTVILVQCVLSSGVRKLYWMES